MSDQTNPIQNQAQTSENSNNLLTSIANTIDNAVNLITGDSDEGDESSRPISHIPRSDFSVLVLAKIVAEHWKGSRLTLEFTKVEDFLLLIDEYEVARIIHKKVAK